MRQAERRAQTRQRLLDAATEVFARKGFHAATIDDVAVAAGHTKGAVYAHFDGKDALFLALLDRHLADQLARVDDLIGASSGAELHRGLRDASAEQMDAGGSFGLLMLEFWLYAAREPRARAALADRYAQMRERLARAIAERGSVAPRSPGSVASQLLALDAGLFLQHLIDPDAITAELRADALAALLEPAPAEHDGGPGRLP